MNQFYIAMGQGVVAPTDVEIFTETLLYCTFIAGYRAGGTHGGAFHYQGGTLHAVGPVIQEWMVALRPVEIRLVFAAPTRFGTGTTASDQSNLMRWFREGYSHIPVTTTSATAACMTLTRGRFYAGATRERASWNPETGTDLQFLDPGQHADYHLFSAESRMSAAAQESLDAAAVASSGPHRRGKRSWMKKNCIVM